MTIGSLIFSFETIEKAQTKILLNFEILLDFLPY